MNKKEFIKEMETFHKKQFITDLRYDEKTLNFEYMETLYKYVFKSGVISFPLYEEIKTMRYNINFEEIIEIIKDGGFFDEMYQGGVI